MEKTLDIYEMLCNNNYYFIHKGGKNCICIKNDYFNVEPPHNSVMQNDRAPPPKLTIKDFEQNELSDNN